MTCVANIGWWRRPVFLIGQRSLRQQQQESLCLRLSPMTKMDKQALSKGPTQAAARRDRRVRETAGEVHGATRPLTTLSARASTSSVPSRRPSSVGETGIVGWIPTP